MVAEDISIEVAAATPDRQVVVALTVPAGTTLAQAVARADLPARVPGFEVDEDRLGIHGKRRRPDSILQEGDRAEAYRPLTADPKEVRRQLAELARSGNKNKGS